MGATIDTFKEAPSNPTLHASEEDHTFEEGEEVDRLLCKFIRFDPNQNTRITKKIRKNSLR